MKAVTKYQCEICGHWHEKEEDALECEQCHLKIQKTETIYQWYEKAAVPFRVTLVFADPRSVTYDRKKREIYERIREDRH